jgi:hypothetical protein
MTPNMPALTKHFGILPPDLDDMSGAEIDEYMRAARQIEKAQRQRQRTARGRRRR